VVHRIGVRGAIKNKMNSKLTDSRSKVFLTGKKCRLMTSSHRLNDPPPALLLTFAPTGQFLLRLCDRRIAQARISRSSVAFVWLELPFHLSGSRVRCFIWRPLTLFHGSTQCPLKMHVLLIGIVAIITLYHETYIKQQKPCL
jgi:hypothetical protein